ncbi:MAG: farnesyl diphosphate synthase [Pseudomonadota bacterium]|nr:farnesyl diphosphate synthase [Pseudomonadota bacterium]
MENTDSLTHRWPIWLERVEDKLNLVLPGGEKTPEHLHQAMRYSVLGAGKRFRAALVYATGESLGVDLNILDVPACAVELVHAFSLIHDDLPAMDDDAFRRGKPSCHLAFDEATAILAGDALQTLAFESIADNSHLNVSDTIRLRMITTLAQAVGSQGMAGGQTLDLQSADQALSETDLKALHGMKTGALISASVILGAMTSDPINPKSVDALQRYAEAVGLGFQIADDILDEISDPELLGKPQGADKRRGKSTYLSLLGQSAARHAAETQLALARQALQALPLDTQLLNELAQFAIERRH